MTHEPGHDRDDEGRADLDEAAEQGRLDPPLGTSNTGGTGEETAGSYEERQESEEGRA